MIVVEPAGPLAPVYANYRQATDILRNLFVNAVEAMPHGGTITLRAYDTKQDIAIEVADTGVGIEESMLKRVFDLSYSTKGSSGFGLWSARRNALANGGELIVRSKLGEGTTFTLSLPKATTPMEGSHGR